jgi:mono/diheme cytochrome c family protein
MFTRSLLVVVLVAGAAAHAEKLGIGTPAAPEILRAWDIDVSPDGAGLPPGHGSVVSGARIYAERCAVCHGPNGEGQPQDRLSGGQGTLLSEHPIKTIGSFWPYATTLFDYVRRAMPFNAPQSLSDDEVYAVVAYLLYLNAILPADGVMDSVSLPAVRMPNRDGFVPDPRPDVH